MQSEHTLKKSDSPINLNLCWWMIRHKGSMKCNNACFQETLVTKISVGRKKYFLTGKKNKLKTQPKFDRKRKKIRL